MDLPLSIKDTHQGLLKKKFSAVDLVNSYLARIERLNSELNVYLTLSHEEAYRQARRIDKAIEQLANKAIKELPLLGVSVAHKDLYLSEGVRTTAGSKVLETYVPSYSATVVKKLEDSGCIMLGKTNCDAWGHGASGENSDFGPSKNPWNQAYVPGGSSSGSAVAVAASLTLVATGTDTGGSIRQPASFCGIVGLKPSYGAVSRYGVVAMASSLDSMGCFARNVEDVERVFGVIKGEDEKDGTVKSSKLKVQSSKLKLGVPREYFVQGIDKEVERTVLAAADVFKKRGIDLVEVSLPHTKYAISVYYIIQPAEVSSNLSRYDGVRYGNDRSNFGEEARRRIMLGTYVLSAGYYDAYYLRAMKVRSKIIEDFDMVFEKVDALIAPVSPTSAFRLGEKVSDPLQMYLADVYTVAANLAGLPGLAMPSGFSKEGLPLGFQLLGPRFSENTLFALGKLFEETSHYKPKVAL